MLIRQVLLEASPGIWQAIENRPFAEGGWRLLPGVIPSSGSLVFDSKVLARTYLKTK